MCLVENNIMLMINIIDARPTLNYRIIDKSLYNFCHSYDFYVKHDRSGELLEAAISL